MKKVDQIALDEQDKMEIVAQAPHEAQKLLESITPYKGHTLFEINTGTGVIIPAVYEAVVSQFNGVKRKKVLVKENCLYISCLNKKSAAKKYLKWIAERIGTMTQNKK